MSLPYRIVFEDDLALFVTDNQTKYLARFQVVPNIEDDQLASLIFDFSFWRDTATCNDKNRWDERVKPTIQKLISFFFEEAYYSVMYFVCESSDQKHAGRKKIFDQWYEEHKHDFDLIPFHIESKDCDLLGGVIFRKNHPMESDIRAYAESEILIYSATKTTPTTNLKS